MNPIVTTAIMGKFNPLAGVGNVVCWVNHNDLPDGPMEPWESRLTAYEFVATSPEETPVTTYEGVLLDGVANQIALVAGSNSGTRHIFIKMLCVDVKTTYLFRLRNNGPAVLDIIGNADNDYNGSLRLVNYSIDGSSSLETGPGAGYEPGNILVIHAEVSTTKLALWTNISGQFENAGSFTLDGFDVLDIGFLNSEPGYESSGFPNHYYKEMMVVGGPMTEPQIQRARNYLTLQ